MYCEAVVWRLVAIGHPVVPDDAREPRSVVGKNPWSAGAFIGRVMADQRHSGQGAARFGQTFPIAAGDA